MLMSINYSGKHFLIILQLVFKNVSYVIGYTQLLLGTNNSSMEFNNLSRLDISSLLLSHQESMNLLSHFIFGFDRISQFKFYNDLRNLIINECGGHINAL